MFFILYNMLHLNQTKPQTKAQTKSPNPNKNPSNWECVSFPSKRVHPFLDQAPMQMQIPYAGTGSAAMHAWHICVWLLLLLSLLLTVVVVLVSFVVLCVYAVFSFLLLSLC